MDGCDTAAGQLHRATVRDRDLEGELVVVVQRPGAKGQADLLQITRATDPHTAAAMVLCMHPRYEHCHQHYEHCHDDQNFNHSEAIDPIPLTVRHITVLRL